MTNSDSSATPGATPTTPSFLERALDPTERLGEALFGIIMVLSFTLGASVVVKEGHDATRELLIAILGCNLAWGLIDGGMYLLSCLFERSLQLRLIESIRRSSREEEALALVAQTLDDRLEQFTSPTERERLYRELVVRFRGAELAPVRITKQDLLGAVATFWLVTASVIPTLLPFLVLDDRLVALRVSNALQLALLFVVGWRCARATHRNPWLFGSALLLFGLAMVAIALALGG